MNLLTEQCFPSWHLLLQTIRIFTETSMMNDIREYEEDENFKYLVIESCCGDYYGFNLNINEEVSHVRKIVCHVESNDSMVLGWKVARTLPGWIGNADSWVDFISRKDDGAGKKRHISLLITKCLRLGR